MPRHGRSALEKKKEIIHVMTFVTPINVMTFVTPIHRLDLPRLKQLAEDNKSPVHIESVRKFCHGRNAAFHLLFLWPFPPGKAAKRGLA